MPIKTQILKIKENWLLILLFLLLVIGPIFFSNSGLSYSLKTSDANLLFSAKSEGYAQSGSAALYFDDQGFAPQIEERKVVKSSELSAEVKKGKFQEAQIKIKNIIDSSDSFLINESVNKNGAGVQQYYYGQYQIKVEVGKYDSVVSQLKEIGEAQSFNENTDDVTASYANLEIELETEKSRLKRYQEMYSQAFNIEDKINLNDRIFNQERTVKYYEDSLKNFDSKIDYSTINLTLTEKKSNFYYAKFVKFSELTRIIIGSINSLLSTIFALIPYLALGWIVYLIIKVIRRKKRE